MAVTSQIALRIAGTKQRQAGFAPLVTVGVLAGGEGNNMDQVPLVNDKPGYIIKHTEEYILYLLIDRRVKSFDADAPGVLSIALSLAREVQLAEGRSPYTLLKEVYETFRSTYMTPVGDERDSFVNTDIDNDIFREIVQRYPTEPRVGAFIPMNPAGLSGTLCVPESKMEAFFRDTQYPEFASFKDIHISPSCQTFPGLEGLEIPRPVSYDIYVNGNPTGNKLVRADDMYRSGLQSTKYVEYDMISFTLHEILSAPGNQLKIGSATVQLDAASGHIHCTIPKREIMYKLAIDLVGGNDNDQATIRNGFKNGKIRILLGSEDITDLKEIKYSEVSGKDFTLYPNATEKHLLSVKSSLEPNKRELRLKISIVRKTITPAAQPKTSHQPQQPKQNITPEPPQSYDPEPPKSFMGRLGMDWKSLILGLILGLLLGIAGGWYIGTAGKAPKAQSPTSSTDSTKLQGRDALVEPIVTSTTEESESIEETIAQNDAANQAAEQTLPSQQSAISSSRTGTPTQGRQTPPSSNASSSSNGRSTPTDQAQVEADKKGRTTILTSQILQLFNNGGSIQQIRNLWDAQPDLLSDSEKNKIENLYARRTGTAKKRADDFLQKHRPFNSWKDLLAASDSIQ